MKKFILMSASAIAVLGLAACGDTDNNTTQSVPATEQTQPMTPSTPATRPAAAPTDQSGTMNNGTMDNGTMNNGAGNTGSGDTVRPVQ